MVELGTFRKVAAFSILIASYSSQAYGDPIHLTCIQNSSGQHIEKQLVLDEAANTAIFWNDPISAATFTDTEVTWGPVLKTDAGYSLWQNSYRLSRVTGVLRDTFTFQLNSQNSRRDEVLQYDCQVSRRAF